MKVLIRNTPPEDWSLAVRAAKKLLQTEQDDFIISYENGSSFWVKLTKAGNISVSGEQIDE